MERVKKRRNMKIKESKDVTQEREFEKERKEARNEVEREERIRRRKNKERKKEGWDKQARAQRWGQRSQKAVRSHQRGENASARRPVTDECRRHVSVKAVQIQMSSVESWQSNKQHKQNKSPGGRVMSPQRHLNSNQYKAIFQLRRTLKSVSWRQTCQKTLDKFFFQARSCTPACVCLFSQGSSSKEMPVKLDFWLRLDLEGYITFGYGVRSVTRICRGHIRTVLSDCFKNIQNKCLPQPPNPTALTLLFPDVEGG